MAKDEIRDDVPATADCAGDVREAQPDSNQEVTARHRRALELLSRRGLIGALGIGSASALGMTLRPELAEAATLNVIPMVIDTIDEIILGNPSQASALALAFRNARIVVFTNYHAGAREIDARIIGGDKYSLGSDLGGGLFVWDPSSTAPPNRGTVLVPNGYRGAGRLIRIHDGALSVRWFGAYGSGGAPGAEPSHDDSQAFRDAIDALGPKGGPEGGTLFVPPGVYYLKDNLLIDRHMILQGSAGSGNYGPSALLFEEGKGIIVQKGSGIARYGSESLISDLYILSRGAGERPAPADPRSGTGNGIYLLRKAKIQRCFIYNFPNNAIYIWGPGDIVDPEQNCNDWRITDVYTHSCGGWGLYLHGDNSQGGTCIGLVALGNTSGGIYDSSTAGNTYIGCHSEYNLPPAYAYYIDGGNNKSVLIGCYSENSDGPTHLDINAIAIGGTATGPVHWEESPTSRGFIMSDGGRCRPLATLSKYGNRTLTTYLGMTSGTEAAFGWQASDDGNEYRLNYGSLLAGWWEFTHGGRVAMSLSGSNSAVGGGQVCFPYGFLMGGVSGQGSLRRVSAGASTVTDLNPPSAVGAHVGDVALMAEPIAGGALGWVFTAGGWRRFGVIEP